MFFAVRKEKSAVAISYREEDYGEIPRRLEWDRGVPSEYRREWG